MAQTMGMTQTLTAMDRIEAAATEHGWTISRDGSPLDKIYRKGSRYVRVSYGVRQTVTSAHRQTGSYGGRSISGQDKAGQVIALLAQDRWTRAA
jgi:hypothetical protein